MYEDDGFYVDPTARINVPLRFLQGCVCTENRIRQETLLPKRAYIGPYAIIGENVQLGEKVIIDAYCSVDPNVIIGQDTLLTYRAYVGGGAVIGRDCIIGGFISENCRIGDRCRVFGDLIHKQRDTTASWDHFDEPEPSAVIHDDSFVGFGAKLIGGLEIGPKAYICAGAVVTRSVPPLHIASGANQIVHYTQWKGNLKENPIFTRG